MLLKRTETRLTDWLEQATHSRAVTPRGAGGNVARRLSHLVTQIGASSSVPTIVRLLNQAKSQQERMEYLFVLRQQPTEVWPADGRRAFFETLADLERSALGGDGMPGFLQKIRDEATDTLSDAERADLGELLTPAAEQGPAQLTIHRDQVREWTLADQELILADGDQPRDIERGRKLFREVLCSHCHRRGSAGGVVGPDLSSVGSRFSRRDILTSILDPSRVVAEQYRNVPGGDHRRAGSSPDGCSRREIIARQHSGSRRIRWTRPRSSRSPKSTSSLISRRHCPRCLRDCSTP